MLPVAACGGAGAAFHWALSCLLIASKGEMVALEASVCRGEEGLLVLLALLGELSQEGLGFEIVGVESGGFRVLR